MKCQWVLLSENKLSETKGIGNLFISYHIYNIVAQFEEIFFI